MIWKDAMTGKSVVRIRIDKHTKTEAPAALASARTLTEAPWRREFKTLADLSLDKAMLQDVLSKKP
jgi:hypothetical protein